MPPGSWPCGWLRAASGLPVSTSPGCGRLRTEHHVVSRLTGRPADVVVRCKLVDARFLEASVPATYTPSFEVDPQLRFIPVNDLVNLADSGSGFTIVGAG